MTSMINEEIRHIIEPELQSGEKLLWAEKVDIHKKESWIKREIRASKVKAPLAFTASASLFFFWIHDFGTSGSFNRNLAILLIGLFLLVNGWFHLNAILNPNNHYSHYPYMGYALTTSQLIFVKADRKCESHQFTRLRFVRIKKSWHWPVALKPQCLVVSPNLTDLFKWHELYFLPDFKKAKQELKSLTEGFVI